MTRTSAQNCLLLFPGALKGPGTTGFNSVPSKPKVHHSRKPNDTARKDGRYEKTACPVVPRRSEGLRTQLFRSHSPLDKKWAK